MRGKFVDGAKKNGHNEKKAAHIFDLMEHFAGYGFNKSHSTAYAFLAYQTAYLKANYPWHFAAALLTIEAQNTDKLALYLGECRDRGIPVLPPDINESQLRVHRRARARRALRPDRDQERRRGRDRVAARGPHEAGPHHARCTRCARISICGWSTSASSRAWSRPARSIRSRSGHGVRRPAVARRCGRGCIGADRRRVRARRAAAARSRARARRSCSARFGDRTASPTRRRGAPSRCPPRRRGPRPSSSAFEKETLGLYWSGHPVDRYAERAAGVRRPVDRRARRGAGRRRRATTRGARAAASRSSPTPRIGGIVAACRQLKTRKGDRMAVFTLEDAQGGVEVDRLPRGLSARGQPDRDRHAGAGARQARTRRRVGAHPGVGDRAARQRARAAGARGRDPRSTQPADRRHVRGARRDLLAPSRRSARLVRDRAADAASRLRVPRRRHRRRSASGRRRR